MHKVSENLKKEHKHNNLSPKNKNKFKKKKKLSSNYNWSYYDGVAFRKDNDFLGDIYYKNGKKERSNIPREVHVDSINSVRLKKHPIRNGTRNQKFSKAPFYCSVFFNEYREYFEKYDIDVDRSITAHGCWRTNKHTLQDQLVPETTGPFSDTDVDLDLSIFNDAARNTIRKLKIETLCTCVKENILTNSYNKNTYAGFTYDQLLFKPKKKDCIDEAVKLASKRWDIISNSKVIKRNDIFPSLYTVGARNKRDHTYDDFEVAKSRVVHMPEFHTELTSGPWIDSITKFLKYRAHGPIFLGNSFLQSDRLKNLMDVSSYGIEGDFKRFDSTNYLKIIICAVSILRCFYELDDEIIDRHFIAIFDCVGIKDYYVPGGNVVRAFHGLPSGVKCTNLLGSIITNISLNFCLDKGANRNFSYASGGDDFAVFALNSNFKAEDIIEHMEYQSSLIGMKFKFLKIKEIETNCLEDLPCFYKYVVSPSGLPQIPISAMLERVFLPWNIVYNTPTELLKFLDDVLPSLGHPGTNLILYYLFYTFVYEQVTGKNLSVLFVMAKHNAIYNKMVKRNLNIPFNPLEDVNKDKSIALLELNKLSDIMFFNFDLSVAFNI
jgi:hypothetical protein